MPRSEGSSFRNAEGAAGGCPTEAVACVTRPRRLQGGPSKEEVGAALSSQPPVTRHPSGQTSQAHLPKPEAGEEGWRAVLEVSQYDVIFQYFSAHISLVRNRLLGSRGCADAGG